MYSFAGGKLSARSKRLTELADVLERLSVNRKANLSSMLSEGSGLARLLSGAISIGAMGVLLWLALRSDKARAEWWTELGLLLLVGLMSCLVAARQSRFWALPTRQLAEMIDAARQGEIAIDELSNVQGGVAQLVPAIQEVLRDLKRERAQIAGMDNEMKMRVAGRTSALERELGALKAKATRDGLTGLFNRRMLDETLPKLLEQALTGGRDLCVLMLDVDYFKLLNDTRGHAAGDEFLKSLGQLIRSSIRPEDYAFRCGGDEFVVLLPGAGKGHGEGVASRLRSIADAFVKPMRCEKPPRVSVGIAALSDVGEKRAGELMKVADAALYAVKAERKSLRKAG
jgi:diguanylate cyclase (GGDEF)-like protein